MLSERDGTPVPGPAEVTPALSESLGGTRGLSPVRDASYRPEPELLEEAADILEAPIARVFPYAVGGKRLFLAYAKGAVGFGARGWFIKREGHYVRLDSGAELIGINEVLRDYRFTREDFNDPEAVFHFLGDVLGLWGVGQGMIGSSYGLAMMTSLQTGLSDWLGGTEKNEGAIRELSHDPEFVFVGNKWKVTFNMLRPGGSVNQFILVGRHDPQGNTNQILRMNVTTIRPPGTFSYPLGG